MSSGTSNTHLKQIKALPAERINGKIRIQNKQDYASMTNGNVTTNGNASTATGKATSGQQGEGFSPEQRRRVSGRPQMTTEEQKLALRKRVWITAIIVDASRWSNSFQRSMVYKKLEDADFVVRNSTTNILAKYKDQAPSLIIHLHPTHFRFDQQVCPTLN